MIGNLSPYRGKHYRALKKEPVLDDRKPEKHPKYCTKIIFNTKEEAETESHAIWLIKEQKMVPYLCNKCKLWHLATEK